MAEAAASGLAVELLKLLPSLLWIALAAAAFWILYRPLLALVEKGEVSKIGIGVIQFEFVRKQIEAISGRPGVPGTPQAFQPFEDRIRRTAPKLAGATLLWVDDKHPIANVYERRALSALGIGIDMARTTEEAMRLLNIVPYHAVISNMNRPDEPDNAEPCFPSAVVSGAGCALLKRMADKFKDDMPPTIIYAGAHDPKYGTPPYALGMTNRVDRLLQFVLDAMERRRDAPVDPTAPTPASPHPAPRASAETSVPRKAGAPS